MKTDTASMLPRRELCNALRGTRSKLNKNRPEVLAARAEIAEIYGATQNRPLTAEESDAARAALKRLHAAWRAAQAYPGLVNK